MTEPLIRTNEGAEDRVVITWDTVWSDYDLGTGKGSRGDWKVADTDIEPRNVGGLQATDPLATAVILCLGTKGRRPSYLDIGDPTVGGWHGDSFDIDEKAGEGPSGSLLWTLKRAVLSEENRQLCEVYAQKALQCLITQGAVAKILTTAEIQSAFGQGYLLLHVQCFAGTGKSIFAGDFPIR